MADKHPLRVPIPRCEDALRLFNSQSQNGRRGRLVAWWGGCVVPEDLHKSLGIVTRAVKGLEVRYNLPLRPTILISHPSSPPLLLDNNEASKKRSSSVATLWFSLSYMAKVLLSKACRLNSRLYPTRLPPGASSNIMTRLYELL
jgi:hypothetical protein